MSDDPMNEPVGKQSGTIAEVRLAQVRDILIGDQLLEFAGRLDKLEDLVFSRMGALSRDIHASLESLERHFEQDLITLEKRLDQEERARGEVLDSLKSQFDTIIRILYKNVRELRSEVGDYRRTAREEFIEQTKAVRNEAAQENHQTRLIIEKTCEKIETNKVDRKALAATLSELAHYLQKGFS